jgi:DNA-binding NarL/FixJ family response regulator
MGERSESNLPMVGGMSSTKGDSVNEAAEAIEVAGYRPRVIVIDGDGDVLALLETMFEVADGFELVATSADADLGVLDAAAHQPDAVVVDLDLPNIDGVQVVGRLRRAAPRSRIIVFSAFPDPLTLMEVLRLGADEYLDKARTWADLLPTVELLCASPRAPQSWLPADVS